ncbi:hypothetical protein C0995_005253 [Termitomyces sp. Mi166|nr:hypothetical protein C0995_005253 [Termitomyces sp. Mi166\
MAKSNIESGNTYIAYPREDQGYHSSPPKTSKKQLLLAFLAGVLVCGTPQLFYTPGQSLPSQMNHCSRATAENDVQVLAPPYLGSTEIDNYPPTLPTNVNPTLFPSDVGYAGATPTGAEPAIIVTAPSYPIQTGAAQLVKPDAIENKSGKGKGNEGSHSKDEDFDLFKKWGNLSPWYSVGKGAFGLDSDPIVPETCRVTGLHFLHRHGARYPAGAFVANDAGTSQLLKRLDNATPNWNATGKLDFLNTWTYKLGEEDDLGVSMRLKYGFLLKV